MFRRIPRPGIPALFMLFLDKLPMALPIGLPMLLAMLLGVQSCTAPAPPPPRTHHSELAYLETMNKAGPASDPRMIFLLMGQYLNANQSAAGVKFFSALLEKHGNRMPAPRKSLYLSALALLRVTQAPSIPLLRRVDWVEDSIAMLEEAKTLSGGKIFVVRWIRGIVFTRLPERFETAAQAKVELQWCLEHAESAPDAGWLREVYFHLALLRKNAGDPAGAAQWLAKSGYRDDSHPMVLTTPYAVNARDGFTFSPPIVREVVPGTLFALSGFEFTEYYFIVSRDRKQLIAIDAGTRPETAKAAYTALRRKHPGLPPLTTIFVTHAHWDHIGGAGYFRSLDTPVRIYARANYRVELDRILSAPGGQFRYFFGEKFQNKELANFRPDDLVKTSREVVVGGTRFGLIPVPGGETPDGLFIHLPEQRVLFVGDFIMPYFGAPFIEEGSLPGLFRAMDTAVALKPDLLLHGHRPLTRLYSTPGVLAALKPQLVWLRQEVIGQVREGTPRAEIHAANLIPPALMQHPEIHVAYLVMRENLINRVYDRAVGYWEPGLAGMDHLGLQETGAALTHYLSLSQEDFAEGIRGMLASGDHELAARTVRWGLAGYPESPLLSALRDQVYRKLIEKYQALNPFKFILYSQQIGQEAHRSTAPQ